MHILVVDESAGPLATRCRALVGDRVRVHQVTALPMLTDALRRTRFDAIIATGAAELDVATALMMMRLRQPAAWRLAVTAVDAARLADLAHRILPEVPSTTVLRAMVLVMASQGAVVPRPLDDVIGGVAALPSVTRILDELRSVLADSRTSARDVGRVVGRDPALAAKVLHLANWAFVRRTAPVTTLEQAVAVLGLHRLREVVIASAAFTAAEQVGADPELVAIAQRHGVAAARAVAALPDMPDHATTGALLIDVGLPLMALAWPHEHARLRGFCRSTGTPIAEEERRWLGVTHADAGGLLARRWSLPFALGDMVAGHHFIPRTEDRDDRALGFLAHYLAQQEAPESRDPWEPDLADHVPGWVAEAAVVAATGRGL